MRTEILLGVFNVAAVVCFLLGPEWVPMSWAATAGAGFFSMGIGMIVVQSCREEFPMKKEEEHGTR